MNMFLEQKKIEFPFTTPHMVGLINDNRFRHFAGKKEITKIWITFKVKEILWYCSLPQMLSFTWEPHFRNFVFSTKWHYLKEPFDEKVIQSKGFHKQIILRLIFVAVVCTVFVEIFFFMSLLLLFLLLECKANFMSNPTTIEVELWFIWDIDNIDLPGPKYWNLVLKLKTAPCWCVVETNKSIVYLKYW